MNKGDTKGKLVKELSKRVSYLPRLYGKGSQNSFSVDVSVNFLLTEVSYGNWWNQYFSYKLYDKVTGREIIHLIVSKDETPPKGTEELSIGFLQYTEGSVIQDKRIKSYPVISENQVLEKVVSYIPNQFVILLLEGFKILDRVRKLDNLLNQGVSKNG